MNRRNFLKTIAPAFLALGLGIKSLGQLNSGIKEDPVSAISYDGDSMTINKEGTYEVSYMDGYGSTNNQIRRFELKPGDVVKPHSSYFQ